MTVVTLPPELAPTLRAAAEQLIAECGEADNPRRTQPPATRAGDGGLCYFCHQPGKLGGHHLDPHTVVRCHHKCHRQHHAALRAAAR